MNKVKLIIELDEEIYNRIKNGYPEPSDCFKCQDEVLNGTPLEDEIMQTLEKEIAELKRKKDIEYYNKSRSVMRRIAIQSESEEPKG